MKRYIPPALRDTDRNSAGTAAPRPYTLEVE